MHGSTRISHQKQSLNKPDLRKCFNAFEKKKPTFLNLKKMTIAFNRQIIIIIINNIDNDRKQNEQQSMYVGGGGVLGTRQKKKRSVYNGKKEEEMVAVVLKEKIYTER